MKLKFKIRFLSNYSQIKLTLPFSGNNEMVDVREDGTNILVKFYSKYQQRPINLDLLNDYMSKDMKHGKLAKAF